MYAKDLLCGPSCDCDGDHVASFLEKVKSSPTNAGDDLGYTEGDYDNYDEDDCIRYEV